MLTEIVSNLTLCNQLIILKAHNKIVVNLSIQLNIKIPARRCANWLGYELFVL